MCCLLRLCTRCVPTWPLYTMVFVLCGDLRGGQSAPAASPAEVEHATRPYTGPEALSASGRALSWLH